MDDLAVQVEVVESVWIQGKELVLPMGRSV